MSNTARVGSVVFWLGLTFWIAALASGAIAAMHVFGTLPKIGLTLSEFGSLPVDDQARIAGGKVMVGVFGTVNGVQCIGAALTMLGLVIMRISTRRADRSWLRIGRTVCVLIALALLAYQLAVLSPRLNHELHAYWESAAVGDVSAARMHRAAFDADHPRSTQIFSATLIALLLAVVSAAAAPPPRA